jgi:ATP-dependent helicase/DNAse subunit B
MAKKKLSEIELKIQNFSSPKIDYSYQRSISYSQFSTYLTCPHQWYLTHVKNLRPYTDNINTIFGTAIHETLQHYITVMYTESGAAADRENLQEIFQNKLIKLYKNAFEKTQVHFSSPEELQEFFDDGVEILNYIKKKRTTLFSLKNTKLLGIEIPLNISVHKNIFLKGYIDVVFYDEQDNIINIIDFKTSKNSWNDEKKKDKIKQHQLMLYKYYFSQQFGVEIDNINVQFIVLKRKLYENSDFPQSRTQIVAPPSGKIKMKKCLDEFQTFINDCFDKDGKIIDKSYQQNVSDYSCKFCPYSDKKDLCPQKK